MKFLRFDANHLDRMKHCDVVASLYDYPRDLEFLDSQVASVSFFVSGSNTLEELESTMVAKQLLHYFFPANLWTAVSPLRKRLGNAGWKSVSGGPCGHFVFAKA